MGGLVRLILALGGRLEYTTVVVYYIDSGGSEFILDPALSAKAVSALNSAGIDVDCVLKDVLSQMLAEGRLSIGDFPLSDDMATAFEEVSAGDFKACNTTEEFMEYINEQLQTDQEG